MTEQPTFSLAVVRGASAGRALRSARKRISVGSAPDNDLIVDDPGVAPRHFLVLIDGGRWRIHSLTETNPVRVDKRWTHPDNGKRGAVIHAGGAEIILFPGNLDQRTVDREVALRVGVEDATEMATSLNIPAPALDRVAAYEPTVAVPAIDPAARQAELDLVELAQMPTIAGERPPEELREAAQQMLANRRGPVAPSVLRENSHQTPAFDPLANAPVLGELPKGLQDERTVGLPLASRGAPPPPPRPLGGRARAGSAPGAPPRPRPAAAIGGCPRCSRSPSPR